VVENVILFAVTKVPVGRLVLPSVLVWRVAVTRVPVRTIFCNKGTYSEVLAVIRYLLEDLL
jgi:hypothetical protein